MKKIHYLLALLAVITVFSACNPLDKTYKDLGAIPKPVAPQTTFSLTLAAADYSILPKGNAAKTALYFKALDSAKAGIPIILASKYPTYGEKSSVTVTYNVSPSTVKLVDSAYTATPFLLPSGATSVTGLTYTLVNNADYLLLPGNKFADFSVAQMLTWLPNKYPAPVEGEFHVFTWIFYPTLAVTAPQISPGVSVSTTGNVTTAVGSFLYTGGAWIAAYHLTPAQYAAIGIGQYNQFTSSTDQPTIIANINSILKTDPSIVVAAKVGSVQYVSYNWYNSSAKLTYQRVAVLTFDGTNWNTNPTTASLTFAKTNGVWVPDNTVTYSLTVADMKSIGTNQPNVASAAATANLASFGDYNIQGAATTWTDDQINTSISVFLSTKYTTAVANQKFVITYIAYNGANLNVTKTFVYNGTAFVYTP